MLPPTEQINPPPAAAIADFSIDIKARPFSRRVRDQHLVRGCCGHS
jgi:hypothetical protein